LRTRLQAVLQSTALVRNRNGFTGKLDTRRLSGTSVGNARVFLRQNRRQAINTAIHILLDASGSMYSCMTLAAQACFAVASALEGIPGTGTAITVFPADPVQAHNSSDLIGQTVFPLLKHKEKLHGRMRMTAAGGTPLDSALWWVIQRMHTLSEERKIILIITDGRPDNESETVKAIRTARQAGMEIYGIGIADAAIMLLLPENGMIVRDIHELAIGMFAMLRKAMVAGRSLP
jgi:nitric oxide reductase activation protein